MDDLEIQLRKAQQNAKELVAALEAKNIIRVGVSESELSQAAFDLAFEMFGTKRHWHKRIVRSGPNTLCHFDEHPDDRTIESDDILFLDLGPVFGDYEADFGATFVVGADPLKLKVKDCLKKHFALCREHFFKNPHISGAELFLKAQQLAQADDLVFWGKIAGHTIGEFPHKTLLGRGSEFLIGPDNHAPLIGLAPTGRPKHWILEIFLAPPSLKFAGFFEDLLTI